MHPSPVSSALLTRPVLCPFLLRWAVLQRTLPAPTTATSSSSNSSARASGNTAVLAMCSRRAGRAVDWQAIPSSALVHALRLASTWQSPATCQASLVCRAWRQISRGCSGLVLLYVSGFPRRDESFAAWLRCQGHQVTALTLCGSNINRILTALAQAAAAAADAGRPLPLHTLRVLDLGPQLDTTRQLLANLPNMRHLQLPVPDPQAEHFSLSKQQHLDLFQQHLAPLQQLKRLKELHVKGPARGICCQGMAQLLPLSLERLSWQPSARIGREEVFLPDLKHLIQLTSLQLEGWAKLQSKAELVGLTNPPALPDMLQELQLRRMDGTPAATLEQAQVLTGYDPLNEGSPPYAYVQQLMQLTRLKYWKTGTEQLCRPKVVAALPHIDSLAHLHVVVKPGQGQQMESQYLAAVADGLPHLRHLHLELLGTALGPAPQGLAALTGLTRLVVTSSSSAATGPIQDTLTWGPALAQLTALRWLSLPAGLLAMTYPCLGRLQQLRVLALSCVDDFVCSVGVGAELLEVCVQQAPAQLQVLGLYDETVHDQAASWRLWRRLGGMLDRLLGSSRAQVVVGVDLDVVGDPGQRWAGLPEAVREALMAPCHVLGL